VELARIISYTSTLKTISYIIASAWANFELNAAKEKLEIVSDAVSPPFRIFAGGFFRKSAFGLIQEYCTRQEIML